MKSLTPFSRSNFYSGKNQFQEDYATSAGNPQLTEATIDRAICDGRSHMTKLIRTYKIS